MTKWADYGFAWDNASRITQIVSPDGTADYDDTNQLVDADHTVLADEAYAYDSNGNRTMTGYSTGSNNQMTFGITFTTTKGTGFPKPTSQPA